jgi:DNA replication initiation complex subunit (GINS family)
LIEYRKAKDAWLREITSGELQELPPGFLDELRQTIAQMGQELDRSNVQEPRRSLLAAEQMQLKTFHNQIVGRRLTKIAAMVSLDLIPRTQDPMEQELVEATRKLISSYKERFYRIPGESSPDRSPAEIAGPAATEPLATQVEGPLAGPKVARRAQPSKSRNHVLRIVKDFPCFVGPDLRTYGPIAKGDIVALPDEISGLLITRKVGEKAGTGGEEA